MNYLIGQRDGDRVGIGAHRREAIRGKKAAINRVGLRGARKGCDAQGQRTAAPNVSAVGVLIKLVRQRAAVAVRHVALSG